MFWLLSSPFSPEISRSGLNCYRVFVAEYDFSKYFDNISHEYLQKILRDRQFLVTPPEKSIVDAFLRTRPIPNAGYEQVNTLTRERGIPQGTSISLFLANVAAWELDRSLEGLGVSFVRYADDTLIWSSDYSQLCRAVEELHGIASRIESPINFQKSGGISLLVPKDAPAEFSKKLPFVEYLGHRISASAVGIKSKVVERIKDKITKLLYFNLIREPKAGTQNPNRLASTDKDYVTYVWQLRRYLYGDISERRLRRFRAKGIPRRRFRGVMSFFPLIDDNEQLETLDGWLVSTTWMALQKRSELLARCGHVNLPDPHGLSCNELAGFIRKSHTTGGSLDLRLPSFRRIAEVIRRAANQYGTGIVSRSSQYEY